MKKLILLFIAGAVSYGVNAQQNGANSPVLKVYKTDKYVPVDNGAKVSIGSGSKSANKGTGTGGNRWYSQFEQESLGGYTSGTLTGQTFVFPIGWDSTQHQRFVDANNVTSYGPVNWMGAAQFIDPIYSVGFNQTLSGFYTGSDIKVNAATPYTVDSIKFRGAYMIGTAGDPATVDTLYLSVAPMPYDDITNTNAKVIEYDGVPEHNNEMKYQRMNQVDSITHQLNYTNTVKWKVPIDPTVRKDKTPQGQYPTVQFTIEVPGGLNVPAGQGFGISVAFKPGEPIVKVCNTCDTVQKYHYFMPIAAQSADNSEMPYFYYTYNDHTMSYLTHNSGAANYGSAIGLEIANNKDFAYEFLDIAGHVVCSSCWDLGVNNTNSSIEKFNAYPNPAVNELTIAYSLTKTADLNITITNAVGQVMEAKNIANALNGNAAFSVANLTNGVYFYTVTADGQNITRRFTVAH